MSGDDRLSQALLRWIAGCDRADWLDAMDAEAEQFDDLGERKKFRRGCRRAIIQSRLSDRQFQASGVRMATVVWLVVGATSGLSVAAGLWEPNLPFGFAVTIAVLCFAYLALAFIAAKSGLWLYRMAVIGGALGLVSRIGLIDMAVDNIPDRLFYHAIALEVIVLMAMLVLLGLFIEGGPRKTAARP